MEIKQANVQVSEIKEITGKFGVFYAIKTDQGDFTSKVNPGLTPGQYSLTYSVSEKTDKQGNHYRNYIGVVGATSQTTPAFVQPQAPAVDVRKTGTPSPAPVYEDNRQKSIVAQSAVNAAFQLACHISAPTDLNELRQHLDWANRAYYEMYKENLGK